MRSYTFAQRLRAPGAPAEPVASPVAVVATTLASRFPLVHRMDAAVANACDRRQQKALDVLAAASSVPPQRAKHTLAKAAANMAGGLVAGQTYRLVGHRRDKWLHLVPPPVLQASARSGLDSAERLFSQLQARLAPAEHTPLVPPPQAATGKPAALAGRVGRASRRVAQGGQHAVQLSLAVGMSSGAVALTVPSGLLAASAAYLMLRLCLHLQSDDESHEWLATFHAATQLLRLPVSQRVWLLAHRREGAPTAG